MSDSNDDWDRLRQIIKTKTDAEQRRASQPGLVVRVKNYRDLPQGSMLRRALEGLEQDKPKKQPPKKQPPKKQPPKKKSPMSVKSPNGVWTILGK